MTSQQLESITGNNLAKPKYLRHYAEKPFELNRDWLYPSQGWRKPHGLWATIDGPSDWYNWCLSNEYDIPGLAWSVKIYVNNWDDILYLPTRDDLNSDELHIHTRRSDHEEPDWVTVSQNYKGVVSRVGGVSLPRWYTVWDCTSAAFWDLSAIRFGTWERTVSPDYVFYDNNAGLI